MNRQILEIERKFLDKSYRGDIRKNPPMAALTAEECVIYADYLDSKGQPEGAAMFRTYQKPIESKKKRKGKTPDNTIEIELYALTGERVTKLTVDKKVDFVIKGDRQFVKASKGRVKNKFYETSTRWNLDEKDERVYIWK